MNKLIPLLAFSVLLLVPVSQNAFAIDGFVEFSEECVFGNFQLGFFENEQFIVTNTGPLSISVSLSGVIVAGPISIPPFGSANFNPSGTGQYTASCAQPLSGSTSFVQGNVLPAPECGNNIQELGEQCDDGNTSDGDGCSSLCMIEPEAELSCGPGTVEVNRMCVCEQQNNQCVGGVLIDTNTVSLLAGSIGIDPLLTGLVGLTIGGLTVQAVWFVHRRKKNS